MHTDICKIMCKKWHVQTGIRKQASANWHMQFKLIYELIFPNWHLETGICKVAFTIGISKFTGISKPVSPYWDLQTCMCSTYRVGWILMSKRRMIRRYIKVYKGTLWYCTLYSNFCGIRVYK